jgi:thymidylate synthase
MASDYGIPILTAEAENLPLAWEKAVLLAWKRGEDIKTEYDKPKDPPSKDCTMIIVVKEPMKEPRIHRAFPGGLEDLEVYRQEVLFGIHDHWINPKEGKWTYTYHKRLFDYESEARHTNQIDLIIDKLSEVPYSRRAQAITWNVNLDCGMDDPPCLQRLWFRISITPDGKKVLNMNTHWRSRDAFKASFMNMFALTDLQKTMAEEISRRNGEEVGIGRYIDISDSFHIYGSYYEDFKKFLRTVKTRSFKDRTWHTEFAEPFFEEARKRIQAEKESEVKRR